jgi:hypothetical protein
MHEYLAQHPDIFMSGVKEPHYFGADLGMSPSMRVRDEGKYLRLFASAGQASWRGESSVWYLYSEQAAREIKDYSPGAKIVILLRNPPDMLYSLHGQFLYSGNEDITDFEQALAAEDDRRNQQRMPPHAHTPRGLFYGKVVSFAEQVARYFDAFGRDNVHIILYDDLRRDLPGVYRGVLEFLGLNGSFSPQFEVFNKSRPILRLPFHQFLTHPLVRAPLLRILPKPVRTRLVDTMLRFVRPSYRSPKLDPTLRARLLPRFTAEIDALETLLGRDLRGWKACYSDVRANQVSQAQNAK